MDPVDWQEEIEAIHLEILQEKINNYIHFLESKQYVERYGDSLEQKLAKIEQAPSPASEMERRLLYLADLLKIHLLIAESTCEETDIQTKIEENMAILKKYIQEHEIYNLFPFRG